MRTAAPRARRTLIALLAVLATLATSVSGSRPAAADAGRIDWPYFVQLVVADRSSATQVFVDQNRGTDSRYANRRWASQGGVVPATYLLRIDNTGFARSLDGQLALGPQGAPSGPAGTVVVRVTNPGVVGEDVFTISNLGAKNAPATVAASYAPGSPRRNVVRSVTPYIPRFRFPMDVTFHVGQICNPRTYLQVSLDFLGYGFMSPEGIGPGTYRARILADNTVVSLDGKTTFSKRALQSWDHGYQLIGVSIIRSCDQVNNDGAAIIGFDRQSDGSFTHMTTWNQAPDGGYGWQPFNCGAPPPIGPVCNGAEPRPYGYAGGNRIWHSAIDPNAPVPVNAYPGGFKGGIFPATGAPGGGAADKVVTGADLGGGPHVRVFQRNGAPVGGGFFAYPAGFVGGVRPAVCDVDPSSPGDEIITAPGPGGGPNVKVFPGLAQGVDARPLYSFMAYDPLWAGGVFVACGDVSGDGRAEIITGVGPGGGPNVKVFNADGSLISSWYAYDPRFLGGAHVATAKLNGPTQKAEVVTGVGPGGGPHVRRFTGGGAAIGHGFMAFAPHITVGVNVAGGDLNGDGIDEIAVGPAAGAAIAGVRNRDGGMVIPDQVAFATGLEKGVRVAISTAPTRRLIAAQGPGPAPWWLVLQ